MPSELTTAAASGDDRYDHRWRVRTKFGHRYNQPCRIVARGKLNSVLVEFSDGTRAITSRNFVRRRK